MRFKKLTAMIAALALLMGIAGCGEISESSRAAGSLYDIMQYEDNADIYSIEKIDLDSGLAAQCESYRLSYCSDGIAVKGYLSVPKAAIESEKPCKCLLYNRGGNYQIGLLEDTDTAKLCAELGRVVIASQYRGAGGAEGTDEFGGADVHDVIKLIDFCDTLFAFADMDDFCVAGTSRGGMMTYLAARQDSRVKRIISVSGVCDAAACYHEREDMRELMESSIGCTPEEDPAAYEQRSAVCWPDEIKVPALIIHSTEDDRVSYQQAEKLAGLLKDHIDCTFITHEDSVHGIHPEDFNTIREWLGQNK